MAKKQTVFTEQQRKEMAGRLWLHYYNKVLYEKGVITEQERNKMSHKIESWKGPTL